MNSKLRIPYVVGATVTAILAVGLLLVGGALLWADGEKDSAGYLNTDSHRFAANSRALTTENLDVDLGGATEVVDDGVFGKVRLRVTPDGDKPVFVGIARTRDVDAYLRGVTHTTVTDVDYSPFVADYRDVAGGRRPGAPAEQGIWSASRTGSGEQTLTWDVEDGNWSVVVMNADGSPRVGADIRAGASLPFLTPAAWATLGGGVLMLVLTGGLVALAARPRRDRLGDVAPQPAAS